MLLFALLLNVLSFKDFCWTIFVERFGDAVEGFKGVVEGFKF